MKKFALQITFLLLLSSFVNAQNKQLIDKITGFDKYKFGLTKGELGCEYWLCTKHPDIKILNNNVIQVDLNFDYENNFILRTVIIKLETNVGIFESLKKKYGNYKTEIVNNIFFNNVTFYLWIGNTIEIAYYEEKGFTYLRYMKTASKNINEL